MTTSTTFSQISTLELTKLSESRVSRSCILVYLAISSHLRGFEGTTKAFPSIARIMALLGGSVSRRMVFKALKQLKEAGLISVEKTTERKSNTYSLRIREIIQKATAFINNSSVPKSRQLARKKRRGVKSGTHRDQKGTHKRTRKRENSSIDWDDIFSSWIFTGTTPACDILKKIPTHQLEWLRTYHRDKYDQISSLSSNIVPA